MHYLFVCFYPQKGTRRCVRLSKGRFLGADSRATIFFPILIPVCSDSSFITINVPKINDPFCVNQERIIASENGVVLTIGFPERRHCFNTGRDKNRQNSGSCRGFDCRFFALSLVLRAYQVSLTFPPRLLMFSKGKQTA